MGARAYTELVSQTGVILLSQRPERRLQQSDHAGYLAERIRTKQPAISRCHSCHQAGAKVVPEDEMLVVAPLSSLPLAVAMRQAQAEAFHIPLQLRQRIYLLGAITLVVALLVAGVITRVVVRPIRAVTRSVEEIRKGNLEQAVPVPRLKDEMGTLAETTEHMRVSLKQAGEEQERWEGMLEQALGEVTRQRGTLEAIIGSMREGLVVVGRERRAIYCNQAAEDILEIRAQDILGQPVEVFEGAWMGRVTDLEGLRQRWAEAIAHIREGPEVEFELLSGAARRTVLALLFPIGGEAALPGTGVLLRDITQEREVDRMKTEFVSLASHELRSPMAVIYGFADLLLQFGELPEEQRDWAERIYRESGRLSAIVDDLLNISRIEAGRLSLRLEAVDLEPLARGLITTLSHSYPSHSFQMNIPRGYPRVRADADKLTRVLSNLLDNAAKYSPGGGSVVVSARLEKKNDEAIISVADSVVSRKPHRDRQTGVGTFLASGLSEQRV
jgi:two-component system phosphate regulon sensor histidine kinase PhoR